jgi:hypothetical protein
MFMTSLCLEAKHFPSFAQAVAQADGGSGMIRSLGSSVPTLFIAVKGLVREDLLDESDMLLWL